eukprot:3947904-Pyramimonas_sp.AAC.1
MAKIYLATTRRRDAQKQGVLYWRGRPYVVGIFPQNSRHAYVFYWWGHANVLRGGPPGGDGRGRAARTGRESSCKIPDER